MLKYQVYKDTPGTRVDDEAYLLHARSTAILRVAPVLLIVVALLVGLLSLFLEPTGDRLTRLSEMVIAGALGSLTNVFTSKEEPRHDTDTSVR